MPFFFYNNKTYFHRTIISNCLSYMPLYAGPSPPSGTTQFIFWLGSLISHVLQCMQFCAFICNLIPSPSSFGTYSYTPAGQNRCSGPSNTAKFRSTGTLSSRRVKCAGWSPSWSVPVSATEESKSKVILSSGFGYSITSHSFAGFRESWSPCGCLNVQGSLPRNSK